jgi:hypothetical protein
MGKINVSAEGTVAAPAETVYGYIADMREHHPKFLPPAFSEFTVESGGIGGFFERTVAPRVMRGIYLDELTRLDEYARAQATSGPAAG